MNYSNEFLARVYGAYIFSDFRYNGSLGVIRRIGGIDWTWSVVDDLVDKGAKFNVEKCKLLLTRLSSITDEDAIDVAKMCGMAMAKVQARIANTVALVDDTYSLVIGSGITGITFCKDGKPEHIFNIAQIIDFLRSRGYDCGYGEIPSLIDAGIAISKTTLK